MFFLLISFFLISCSQESSITAPNVSNGTALAKTSAKVASIPTSSINHATDTVVTFPKSGKRFVVSKTLTANQLSKMDNYLSTHALTEATGSITPDLQNCNDYPVYSWQLLQQYRSLPPYHMGIWVSPDVISYTKAYNQYGFNELLIQPSELSTVLTTPPTWKADSLMMSLGNGRNSLNIYNANSVPAVGYYFIDEPYQNNVPRSGVTLVESAVAVGAPSAKVMFSDWEWPWFNITCGGYDYSTVSQYLNGSNSGIMCDQYLLSNSCGDMLAFWQEYYSTYSPHSWMNWADNTGSNAGDWANCFNWMNIEGLTNVWLYADESGNEGVIQEWCQNAWEKYWLLEEEQYIQTIWSCIEPSCSDCNYPTEGDWEIVGMYYYNQYQYVNFGQWNNQ